MVYEKDGEIFFEELNNFVKSSRDYFVNVGRRKQVDMLHLLGQVKTVVNRVVFPAIDLILAVFFFAKLGTAYFDYRKHGQFEWAHLLYYLHA